MRLPLAVVAHRLAFNVIMFQEPEDFLLAAFAIVWTGVTFLLCKQFIAMDFSGSLKVTIATGVLLTALFVAWQMGVWRKWFLPLIAGAFIACWYPLLDWIAIKKHLPQGVVANTPIVFNAPWYASWTFKLSLTAAVMVVGFVWLFVKRNKK